MNKGHFFIIARRAQWMYEAMKQSFAGHADIGVILDRRRRERRCRLSRLHLIAEQENGGP